MRYERSLIIQGLREVADLLEQRPDLPIEDYGYDGNRGKPADSAIEITTHFISQDDFYQAAKNIGKGEKDADDWSFKLTRRFGEGAVALEYTVNRSTVCERKEVGKKVTVIPAQEAKPERTVEEPEYEYECNPLLAGYDDGKK